MAVWFFEPRGLFLEISRVLIFLVSKLLQAFLLSVSDVTTNTE